MTEDGEIPDTDFEETRRAVEEAAIRGQIADKVYTWLLKKKRTENIRDQSIPSLQDQATEVLKGLQNGEIFFIVSNLKAGEPKLNPRLLEVNTKKGRVYAVALSVSNEITIEELLKSGDEVIRKMYSIHKKEIQEKKLRDYQKGMMTKRICANDPIEIKVPGIGRFPEIVEEVKNNKFKEE